MKILVLGSSNSNRPQCKCWPHHIAEHFDIHIRNAAFRGVSSEHIYDMYIVNKEYAPDLILVDIPHWNRSHIVLSEDVKNIEISTINDITSKYQEVIYKPLNGLVPIGGPPTPKLKNYTKWLKSTIVSENNINLYQIYKRRVKDKENFDIVINTLNKMSHSSYYKYRAFKDILLLKSTVDIPIKFIHASGENESIDIAKNDFLCENPYYWIKKNFTDYENMFENEWSDNGRILAHYTEETHKLISQQLFIPAIQKLLYNMQNSNIINNNN